MRDFGRIRDDAVVSRHSGWHTHDEAPAFGFILPVPGVAMVGFGKGFDDRQAQTCSLRRPSGWRISAVELGEEPGDEVRRHSQTVVAYAELDEVADSLSLDVHGRFAVLEGVSHVVAQDARVARWIDDRDQLGRTRHGDGAQFFVVRLQIAGQCGGEPEVLGSGLLGRSLDSGRGEQVIGQTRRSQSDAPLCTADSVTDPSVLQFVCTTPVGPSSPLCRLQNLGHSSMGLVKATSATDDGLRDVCTMAIATEAVSSTGHFAPADGPTMSAYKRLSRGRGHRFLVVVAGRVAAGQRFSPRVAADIDAVGAKSLF